MAASVNKFNNFVLSFLKDTSESNNVNELWMASDVQKKVKSLCASAAGSQGRKNKDPNAPKRGKSGYLFFCSDNRDAVKASLGPQAKATDVTKELGLRWNALKDSKKPADKKILAGYEKAAADDKARYQEEKSEYTPPESDDSGEKSTRRRGGKRKSAKKGPKRAKSGYLYFCEQRRDQLKASNPNLKSTEITSELGRLWNELKSDTSRAAELAKYEGMAAEDKGRYETEKASDVDDSKSKAPKKDAPKKDAPKKDAPKKDAPKKDAPKKGKKEEVVEEDDEVVEDEDSHNSKKGSKTASVKKLNGYQKFCEARRPELKAKFSSDKPAEITKKLSDEWKVLSKEDKQKWD
jgi:hypothetical protein